VKNGFYTDSDITTAISIGRDSNCELTVDAKYASRSHANLEFRRGKFVLLDHSTNGTYVKLKKQDDIFIRREQLPLTGEGYISLGEEYKKREYRKYIFQRQTTIINTCRYQKQIHLQSAP